MGLAGETYKQDEVAELKALVRLFVAATDYVDQSNHFLRAARNRAAELVPDIRGYPNSISGRSDDADRPHPNEGPKG